MTHDSAGSSHGDDCSPQPTERPRRFVRVALATLMLLLILIPAGCGGGGHTPSAGSSARDSSSTGASEPFVFVPPSPVPPSTTPSSSATVDVPVTFSAGQKVYGLLVVVPFMLITDEADQKALLAVKDDREKQGYRVTGSGRALAWPDTPGSAWLVSVGAETVVAGPDGAFSVTAPVDLSTAGILAHPVDGRIRTSFPIGLLSASADNLTRIVIPLPFNGPNGMSEGDTGNFDLADLSSVFTFGASKANASKDGHFSCCTPSKRGSFATRIKAVAARPRKVRPPIYDPGAPGGVGVTAGLLGSLDRNGVTYPPPDDRIGNTCPTNNGTSLFLVNGSAYFGSTCDQYVVDGSCPNERGASDAEFLASLALSGLEDDEYHTGNVLSAIFPPDPTRADVPPALAWVTHEAPDWGQAIHCANNHRGRTCGDFYRGDVALGILGTEFPSVSAIVTAGKTETLLVSPGDEGQLIVHNNGSFGITDVRTFEGTADVTLSGDLLPLAGLPSFPVGYGPGEQRLLHFDWAANNPQHNHERKVFSYIPDQYVKFKISASASPGQSAIKQFSVDEDSASVKFIVHDVLQLDPSSVKVDPLQPPSPQTFNVGGPGFEQLLQVASQGGQVVYKWEVIGNAGGTLTGPKGGAGATTLETDSPSIQYTAGSNAGSAQQDTVKLRAFFTPAGWEAQHLYGTASATVTIGDGYLFDCVPANCQASIGDQPAQQQLTARVLRPDGKPLSADELASLTLSFALESGPGTLSGASPAAPNAMGHATVTLTSDDEGDSIVGITLSKEGVKLSETSAKVAFRIGSNQSYTISGGPLITDQWSCDDQLTATVNGVTVYQSPFFAGVRAPFTITARPGDSLEIRVTDTVGGCRSVSNLYIHRNGKYQMLCAGLDLGCHGFPGGVTFFDIIQTIPDLQ